MILLADVTAQLNANTYYSRTPADVLAAINRAGLLLFQRMFSHEVTPTATQWTPVQSTDVNIAPNVLPDAIAPCLVSFATADLLALNNDSNAANYSTIAETQWSAAWLQLRAQRPMTTQQTGTVGQLVARIRARLTSPRSIDELLAAMDGAGSLIYQAIARENRSYFTRINTLLQLQPGTQTLLLPIDCGEVAYLGEQPAGSPAGTPWAEISAESLRDSVRFANIALTSSAFPLGYGSLYSPFSYFGPYLAADQTALATQQQSINISPAVDVPRSLTLVYIARWSPIAALTSPITLPQDATDTLLSLTMAELLRTEPDAASRTLSASYDTKAATSLRFLLSTVRQRRVPIRQSIPMFGTGA